MRLFSPKSGNRMIFQARSPAVSQGVRGRLPKFLTTGTGSQEKAINRDTQYSQSVKLGHELDVFNHAVIINRNFLQKRVEFLITHVQFKPSFNSRAELLLREKTRIFSVNVAANKGNYIRLVSLQIEFKLCRQLSVKLNLG